MRARRHSPGSPPNDCEGLSDLKICFSCFVAGPISRQHGERVLVVGECRTIAVIAENSMTPTLSPAVHVFESMAPRAVVAATSTTTTVGPGSHWTGQWRRVISVE